VPTRRKRQRVRPPNPADNFSLPGYPSFDAAYGVEQVDLPGSKHRYGQDRGPPEAVDAPVEMSASRPDYRIPGQHRPSTKSAVVGLDGKLSPLRSGVIR